MHPISFEWDPGKARRNLRKHGVSFEQARAVFYDEEALLIADPETHGGEERFLLLGLGGGGRELVVCHCMRAHGRVVRIISARRAGAGERREYWERLR